MDTDVKINRKIKILKVLRIIFIAPIVVMVAIAFLTSSFGVDAYIDSFYSGSTAFGLTIIAFMVNFFWIWIISFFGTLVTSILIKRFNTRGKYDTL